MFQRFHDAGLCVIPLQNGKPQTEWSNYFYHLPDKETIGKWNNYNEYALVCGKVSGVIALDIDTDDTKQIYALAGETPVRKRGSKGFTAFYKCNSELSRNWKKDGMVICELLADKRLTTIPPSPHRKTGIPYVWLDKALGDVELPFLNPDFCLFMDAKYPSQRRIAPIAQYKDYDNATLAEASEMLDYISSDCARDEWISIGMALRDEFGDAACNLWHSWSAKAGSKYKINDAQAAWRSFNGDGYTIGTIVYKAKQGGWIPRYEEKPVFEVDLSYLENKKPDNATPLRVHGLVGEIADWITATAIMPQPALSLASAITFVGLMKGHHIQHKIQSARTNMMTLSLAPTGSGKDHPPKAIYKLAKACGMQDHWLAKPTSGTALLVGMQQAKSIGLLSIDEMGRFMGNISGANSQPFQNEICDYFIELFSSANKVFLGKQFANPKVNPQITIDSPHFCCVASTVIEKLKSACKSSQVIDGFLNRWLVFGSSERPKKIFDHKDTSPPIDLVDKIIKWRTDNAPITDNYGNVEPNEIGFTAEAWDIFLKFEDDMQEKLEKEPYPFNELYVRSAEHVVKLSMVICDDDFIGVKDISLAINIVNKSNEQIFDLASGITDNQHESDVVFILDLIKKNPNISKNTLTQKTRRLPQKLRLDILNQLCEGGDIIATTEGKKTTFKLNV